MVLGTIIDMGSRVATPKVVALKGSPIWPLDS